MGRGGDFSMAVALLLGTTIGAGIFGLPYVFARAGFLTGLLNLIIIAVMILFVNLYLGEVALRTKKRHMLAGYASKYLGNRGKYAMTLVQIIGIFGAMIAYLIGEGSSISAIFGGNPLLWSLIFFAIMSPIIWFDLDAVAESDKIINYIMLAIIAAICLLAFGHMNIQNLNSFSPSRILIPYGVVLFAMVGASAIPEMAGELARDRKKLRNAILLGTIIPLIIYLIFSAIVVGVTGKFTTEIATIGLGNSLGEYMILLGNVFAILAMATSFISLGLAMRWMLRYDYGLSQFSSWSLSCFIPLIIFLMGARSFIGVIGITGAVAGGIEGMLLVLIAKSAKRNSERKPEYSIPLPTWLMAIFIFLFLLGIVYQFLSF